MSLLEKFKSTVREKNLFHPGDQLLIAVSGGVDSVVLCELCHQAGFSFSIAHCNFQLRGAESDRDEQLVNNLALKYGVEVLVKRFETAAYSVENKISIQEAARELRYSWFKELNETFNPQPSTPNSLLLTAHHADDNIETLLMHFFRGTGLHGLTGIPERNEYIRRPLLGFRKEELIRFANEQQLAYVEDSSNQSSKYTRNFFRNELLPAISTVFPQVKENLQDNINRFTETEKLYQYAINDLKKKLCRQKGEECHIPVKQLLLYKNTAFFYELIRDYGFGEKQVDELVRLTASESGKYIESPDGQYRIIKHRHWLIISPNRSATVSTIAIPENTESILFEAGKLIFQKAEHQGAIPPAAASAAWLDSRLLQYPLILRKWKTGDYFYPLGMRKKKKLARFFIDLKLSKSDKEKIWVLESNQRIAWVIGYRIDDRFKLTSSTSSILKLQLQIPG
jgi:tRNA(Ile)-lysidine synthase